MQYWDRAVPLSPVVGWSSSTMGAVSNMWVNVAFSKETIDGTQ